MDEHATPTPDTLLSRGLLDVRRGIGWQGLRVPVELELTDSALKLTITASAVGSPKERRAVECLVGEQAISELGPDDRVTADISLREASFAFPRALNRGVFSFRLPDGRGFAVSFSDWSGVEDNAFSTGRILYEGAKSMRKGPAAHRAREAWRVAIEGRLADAPRGS